MNSTRNELIEFESSTSGKSLLVEDADGMSTLPQEVWSQILSYLPTMEAAKVGLLSKICRTAWYSLPGLTFDYSQFPETENKLYGFFNFIDQTLYYHDESDVKTLEVLHWPLIDCDIPMKAVWITFAIMHKVEKLILEGEIDEVKLPDCLFTCQSLVKLELAIPDLVLPSSRTLALPNLRKLKLKFLVLAEMTMDEELFSNLPSLEKLSIFFCYLGYTRSMHVSSMKLKEFIICNCQGMDKCSLELQAPCLSNFIYISDSWEKSDIDVFSSGSKFVLNGEDVSLVSKCIQKLGTSLIKVAKELFKNAYLSYICEANDLPRQVNSDLFHNIMKLDINIWPIMDHVRVLILLASRCPNLNNLHLRFRTPQRRVVQGLSEDSLAENCYSGGFRKVNIVRIEEFRGVEAEMMLVRFLLENMTELRLMRIGMTVYMERKNRRLSISEILAYNKASASADIKFY